MKRGTSEHKPIASEATTDRLEIVDIRCYLFSETYCGGYSGEDPPLPIPNREVKLTIADGTAPPGGRVGSCHALIKSFETTVSELFFVFVVAIIPLTQSDCRNS